MPKSFDEAKIPKDAEYFTAKDVDILPKPPVPIASKPPETPLTLRPTTKAQQEVWERHAERRNPNKTNLIPEEPPIPKPSLSTVPAMRAYIEKVREQRSKKQVAAEEAKEAKLEEDAQLNRAKLTRIPIFLRPFVCPSLERAQGHSASISTFKVETAEEDGVKKRMEEFHFIVCYYQFIIGALAGIVVGVETDHFSSGRFPKPKVPVPRSFKLTEKVAQGGVQTASTLYRIAKRAAVSGLLFDCLDRNIETYRGKKDWMNMGISGLVTGGMFGLRGGLRGFGGGALLFGGFASMAGILYQYRSKPGQK